MNKTRKLQFIILILITFFLGYFIGTSKISVDWKNYKPTLSVTSKEPPAGVSADFSNFWAVWQGVNDKYYDKTKVDPQKMLNGAISGMLGALDDPFTLYLPPVSNNDFKQGMAGEFSGIGAELGTRDNKIVVISPLSDSPAIKAGVKPEDMILKVDGASTQGWTLSQTVSKIRGPKGTSVTLNIQHKDSKTAIDVKIVRGVITVKSIDGYVKKIKDVTGIKMTDSIKAGGEKEIMYLKLSQFGDKTNSDWEALINQLNLKVQNNPNFKGIILDLRNNPGGYLTDAAFITSEFIEKGQPVVMQEESGGGRTKLNADRRGLLLTQPLVVLINKGSASASEIVSGALRDYKRAKLVGETSFGKGTVQQAQDLGGGAGVHITIAKWLTPKGTWVNGKGLDPDIKVTPDTKDQAHDLQLEKAIEELLE
ncbi:MAG: S41 family peptidase [Patescibacteria group bacterium]